MLSCSYSGLAVTAVSPNSSCIIQINTQMYSVDQCHLDGQHIPSIFEMPLLKKPWPYSYSKKKPAFIFENSACTGYQKIFYLYRMHRVGQFLSPFLCFRSQLYQYLPVYFLKKYYLTKRLIKRHYQVKPNTDTFAKIVSIYFSVILISYS